MDSRSTTSDKRHYNYTERVDLNIVRDEVSKILSLASHDGQIMLQGIEGKGYIYGTGKITEYEEQETDFIDPLWDTPYINSTLKKLGMYRTRIMIRSKSVYSWHADYGPRIHIPVTTNPETNFMVIEDEVIRMPADGRVVWVDTTRYHTFVNTSKEDRIHIVGCI